MSLRPSYLVEASFRNVDVTVAHLHVDLQALHHRQTVLVVPQVLETEHGKVNNTEMCRPCVRVCVLVLTASKFIIVCPVSRYTDSRNRTLISGVGYTGGKRYQVAVDYE